MTLESVFFAAVGVFISIMLPVLKTAVVAQTRRLGGNMKRGSMFSDIIRDYIKPLLIISLFSFASSIIVIAFLDNAKYEITKSLAILTGFTSDNVLQRLLASDRAASRMKAIED